MERFATKKSLGQHFLRNPATAGQIADAGELSPGDIVLEIGPGTGVLTAELLARGARVVAVEADERAIHVLNERFSTEISATKLTIRHGDIREITFTELGLVDGAFKIVANIPYYISGMLFRLALGGSIKPSLMVFLVQKEVAERIVRSEKESLLSLGVKAYGDPEYVCTVKKGSFTPPPKVDSAVIRVRNISRNRLEGIPDEQFFDLLRIGFGSRRKQLRGCLRDQFDTETVARAFVSARIHETARGEDLPLHTWVELAHTLLHPND